jgi:copper resistance protein C
MLSVLQWKKLAIRFAAVAALAGLFCLPGDPGLAHSKGPKITPADGSELAEAPAAINFSFARPVRLTAVRLYDAGDNEITLPGKRSIEAARERRVALPELDAGSYRVRWRALSADGHPVNGEFGFTVDPAN